MTSLAFDRFYESFFGDMYMAWHDGLDVAALHELTPDERLEAERLLLEALGSDDWRIPVGLAELQVMSSAPQLKAKINSAKGRARINMAIALWDLEKWSEAVSHVADVLRDAHHWGERIDAAIAMSHFGDVAPREVLWRAIEHDSNELVRYHAVNSLVSVLELSDEKLEEGHRLALAVMSDKAFERTAALDLLRKLAGG